MFELAKFIYRERPPMKWVAAFAAAAGIGAYGGYWYAGDLVSSANSRTEMARSQTDLRNDIIAGLKEELAKCQAQRGVDSPPQPEAPAVAMTALWTASIPG